MTASLSDILTTQKNGVVAINGINQSVSSLFSFLKGSPLSSASLGTSTGTLVTVPANTQYAIVDIEICNTGVATTFSIYAVNSGGTAGTSNAIFYNAPIAPNSTVQWTGFMVLGAGATIQGSAGTANVAVRVSGNAA